MQSNSQGMLRSADGARGDAPFLLFEFAGRDGTAQPLVFIQPVEVVVAHSVEQVRPALRRVEAATARGLWAAGYVGYEAAPAWEAAMPAHASPAPLLWFGIFERALRLDTSELEALRGARFEIGSWVPSVEHHAYAAAIAAIRDAIARGDTYQANYTLRLRAPFGGDSFAYFLRLRAGQHGGYAAYLDTGRLAVLSASPELFFRRDGDTVTARPMKGTARRGRWLEEDRAAAAALAESTKNRAENLMILDLLRNDLGRVAEIGSVRVPRLFSIERYPTVWQMTSTVEATLRRGTTLDDIFAALFPCGSVTGAPKISTMQLLARLESAPRGIYCGALGYISPGGDCVFNVPIRTVLVDQHSGVAEYGVGGGITWDSTAVDEYDETVAKAALLQLDRPRFELLETMLLDEGRFALLERHLERLEASARFWSFAFDSAQIRTSLEQIARSFPHGRQRVRLLLAFDGAVRIEQHALDEATAQPLPVALAAAPIDSNDPFLSNKTTNRAVYISRKAEHPAAYDVLLSNQQGELTEFTTGNLVLLLDGRCWTPPRTSGLLAGTLRAELLERGEIAERVLSVGDLARAEAMWLINSVRGWVRVELLKEVYDPRMHANRRK